MVSFGYSLLSFRKEQRAQRKYVHRSLVTASQLSSHPMTHREAGFPVPEEVALTGAGRKTAAMLSGLLPSVS